MKECKILRYSVPRGSTTFPNTKYTDSSNYSTIEYTDVQNAINSYLSVGYSVFSIENEGGGNHWTVVLVR